MVELNTSLRHIIITHTLDQGPVFHLTGQSTTLQNCCVMGGGWGAEFLVTFSSCSRSLALKSSWKSHQMSPFFSFKKRYQMKKIMVWVKYGNVFTQIMRFSLEKVDDLKVSEWERGEKGTTNSVPGGKMSRPLLKCYCHRDELLGCKSHFGSGYLLHKF